MEKVPYMLVVGDRDMENGTVSVRHRSSEIWAYEPGRLCPTAGRRRSAPRPSGKSSGQRPAIHHRTTERPFFLPKKEEAFSPSLWARPVLCYS